MTPLELLKTFNLTDSQERAAFQLLAHRGPNVTLAYAKQCEEGNLEREERQTQRERAA